MTEEMHFDNTPASIRMAREFVASTVTDLDADRKEAILVMVSELVTNSLRHGDGSFSVAIERIGDHIEVAVTDHGPGQPIMKNPGALEPSGRGLSIVNSFADEWGVRRDGQHKKCVWFRIGTVPDPDARAVNTAHEPVPASADQPQSPLGGPGVTSRGSELGHDTQLASDGETVAHSTFVWQAACTRRLLRPRRPANTRTALAGTITAPFPGDSTAGRSCRRHTHARPFA
jgi:anti-sigma regulatory factor (Ser/Thr protein kinase)